MLKFKQKSSACTDVAVERFIQNFRWRTIRKCLGQIPRFAGHVGLAKYIFVDNTC